jgi:hypothetical protein
MSELSKALIRLGEAMKNAGMKNPPKITLSREDFDALQARLGSEAELTAATSISSMASDAFELCGLTFCCDDRFDWVVVGNVFVSAKWNQRSGPAGQD